MTQGFSEKKAINVTHADEIIWHHFLYISAVNEYCCNPNYKGWSSSHHDYKLKMLELEYKPQGPKF